MQIELLEIDFNSEEAIYMQLRNQIILGIATSRLQDGDTLPSVRQMAECIGIPSVQTSFPYIMMIWKQWQPADMVNLSDFSPFWLCDPAFQQVCL